MSDRPTATCKNCGTLIERCREGCNWGGWFHPARLAEGNPAHYCAGTDGAKAEPPAMSDLARFVIARVIDDYDDDQAIRDRIRHVLEDKRDILDLIGQLLAPQHLNAEVAGVLDGAFREIAAIWADHPDYREEWRP